jgi:hypothetical protein
MAVVYAGFAGPTAPSWGPVNGSRGHRRDQNVQIDFGVLHLWVSPEDGDKTDLGHGVGYPGRYMRQLATPALPGSGRSFQSSQVVGGVRQWLWEGLNGRPTPDSKAAKPWKGKAAQVFRYGTGVPFPVAPGSPTPWCYGPGYQVVLGIDAQFHFAVNPDDVAVNHAPPFNERAIAAVLPGTYNTDAGWKDITSSASLEAFAKLIVYANDRWGIPIRYCNAKDIRAGKKGWTGHVDVNEYAKTPGHGDPGKNCPWGGIMLRAWQLRVASWSDADLAGHVSFWGWADLKAGQRLLNVPESGEWDFLTRLVYANVLAWLASL